ncbi:MAG: class I SAM-dependent RNA methyltransferase [Caulobacteraceae bacterium]|nr:class I SAM-dependent RNA methyltransferase [Caulobacteraceae bacterium]
MRSSHHRRRPTPTSARDSGPAPETELQIIATGGEGDGVATGPVFVPLSLPGERVRAAGTGDRRRLLEVLEVSPERVDPPCPHFGACGGCVTQHWAMTPYLAWKRDRIVQTLARQHIETEVLPIVASPPGSRRRVALHARKGEKGRARLGYKMRGSWDLVAIDACVIADPKIVAALPALERLAAPLLEHPKSAPTLHVTLADEGLDIDVTGVERKSGGLSADARMRLAELAAEAGLARLTLDGEIAYMDQAAPSVRLDGVRVMLPPGAFLQAVPAAERAMASFVAEAAAGAQRIADLFCGVGTFTFGLARIAPVYAADGAAPAIAALNAALATAPGLKGVTAEARDLARRPLLAEEMRKIDTVVFDPPRAGAAEQSAEIARSSVARAIGISCSPATFARDARTLIDAGFRLERVAPVDQFLWSPHAELIGVFSR